MIWTKNIGAAACCLLLAQAACMKPGDAWSEERNPVAPIPQGEGALTIDGWISSRDAGGWIGLAAASTAEQELAENCRTRIEQSLAARPSKSPPPSLIALDPARTYLKVARLGAAPWVGLWPTGPALGEPDGSTGQVLFVFKDCGVLSGRSDVEYVMLHARTQAPGHAASFMARTYGSYKKQREYWYRPLTEEVAILEPMGISGVEVVLPEDAVCAFDILEAGPGAPVPLSEVCDKLPEYTSTQSGQRSLVIYNLDEGSIAEALIEKYDGVPGGPILMEPGMFPGASAYAVLQMAYEDLTVLGNDPIPAAQIVVTRLIPQEAP